VGEDRFERKHKEDRPVLALCYDFDKTLTPDDMQAQGFIAEVGWDTPEFWAAANELGMSNEMDQNLAYMRMMVAEAEGRVIVTREKLAHYGARVKLFPGVQSWFRRIRDYGAAQGVIVEHYIISSGLKEMIEGTEMAKNGDFEQIYASSFYFSDRGTAVWPAQAVKLTNNTQLLFRIEKGVPDVNDPAVNDDFPPDQLRVPFRNMVYIGDSDTDIPCMKLVHANGGYSIGVYDPDSGDRKKVHKMMRDNRIKFFAPADYTENGALDALVKGIIRRTAENEALEQLHYTQRNEVAAADRSEAMTEADREKETLIASLESSRPFANTHTVIPALSQFDTWTDSQRESLFRIARRNKQVYWILKDPDVSAFYRKLLAGTDDPGEDGRKISDDLT
jgi:phosphoserine phosphatase